MKNHITDISTDITFFLPELFLSTLFLIILLVSLFKKIAPVNRTIQFIFLTGLAFNFMLIFNQINYPSVYIFYGLFELKKIAVLYKLLVNLCGILFVVFNILNEDPYVKNEKSGELYAISTAVILGGQLIAMAVNFIMIFLSLELISLSAYILTAYVFKKTTAEASSKYLFYGMFASGVMLYGISLFYGITGSFSTYVTALQIGSSTSSRLLITSFIFVLAGILFKLSAFPFHIWAPDIYEETPDSILAFLSVNKVIGFCILTNLFGVFSHFYEDYISLFSCIGIITLVIGNLSALKQKNLKRLLGYSTISQTGFILMGMVNNTPFSQSAVIYYLILYILLSFATFYFANLCFKTSNSYEIDRFAGMGNRYSLLGIAGIVLFASLTGLPPSAPFIGKFFLFTAAWETYTLIHNHFILTFVLVALITTIVSLFYYFKTPYYFFVRKQHTDYNLNIDRKHYIFLIILSASQLLLFFSGKQVVDFILELTKIDFNSQLYSY